MTEKEINKLYKRIVEREDEYDKLSKKVDNFLAKKELKQVVKFEVNKEMIKGIWQQWQTLLVIIALISLHLFLTVQFFRRDFDRLEKKIAKVETKIDPGSVMPASIIPFRGIPLRPFDSDDK